jgi:hypothetical protein
MPLFIVRHQHDPNHCPAADPYNGANLLNHLSRPNFRKHGLTVHGEAVARGEHTLYMIVEAAHETLVRDYMAPFAMAGSLDVYLASRRLRCESAAHGHTRTLARSRRGVPTRHRGRIGGPPRSSAEWRDLYPGSDRRGRDA